MLALRGGELTVRKLILVMAVCATLAACEKPTAKFHPGDKVKVKITETKGVVALRLSPYVDDLYYLKVPGSFSFRTILDDQYARKSYDDFSPKFRNWVYPEYGRDWHLEGPYYDTDLALTK
jgi:predicted transcriptional regulator